MQQRQQYATAIGLKAYKTKKTCKREEVQELETVRRGQLDLLFARDLPVSCRI